MRKWIGIGWAQPVTRRRYALLSMLAQRGYFALDRLSNWLSHLSCRAFERATT